MQLLTTSRVRNFSTCKRLHFYRYELKRRPIREAEPLSMGRIVHEGLEQWWLAAKEGMPERERYELMINAAHACAAGIGDDTEADEFAIRKSIEMLRGYHVRWLPWSREVEIIDAEVEFTCALVNPATGRPSRLWKLGGKIDLVFADRNGLWFMEHKTTSQDLTQGAPYWQSLRMDSQVSTYFSGLDALGHNVVGCVYDVLKKPQLKPLRATPPENRKYTKKQTKDADGNVRPAGSLYANMREFDESPTEFSERVRNTIIGSPMDFYAHADVHRLDDELREYRADAWITAKAIREAQLTGGHARNPDACFRYNRFCEYWYVCTGACDIDDETRFRHTAHVHQELSEALVASVRPKEVADDETEEESTEAARPLLDA